jgi:hypothetical protein
VLGGGTAGAAKFIGEQRALTTTLIKEGNITAE